MTPHIKPNIARIAVATIATMAAYSIAYFLLTNLTMALHSITSMSLFSYYLLPVFGMIAVLVAQPRFSPWANVIANFAAYELVRSLATRTDSYSWMVEIALITATYYVTLVAGLYFVQLLVEYIAKRSSTHRI